VSYIIFARSIIKLINDTIYLMKFIKKCRVCPFNCGVDRKTKLGVCQAPDYIEISHSQIHFWEEPCISGVGEKLGGSGTIFFSHCNLKCIFCQNYKISQLNHGQKYSGEELFKLCLRLKVGGSYNINLVSPTSYSLYLKSFLEKYKNRIGLPIVWNSNAYEKEETIKSLNGLVDVWLPDFKYYNDNLALKYSKAKNYFQYAASNILQMRRCSPKDIFNKNGIMVKGLLVRHLVLPGQNEDSLKILKWIKDNLGKNTTISLMSQYYPAHHARKYSEINKKIASQEYQILINWLSDNDFSNVFIQDISSANEAFTPNF